MLLVITVLPFFVRNYRSLELKMRAKMNKKATSPASPVKKNGISSSVTRYYIYCYVYQGCFIFNVTVVKLPLTPVFPLTTFIKVTGVVLCG